MSGDICLRVVGDGVGKLSKWRLSGERSTEIEKHVGGRAGKFIGKLERHSWLVRWTKWLFFQPNLVQPTYRRTLNFRDTKKMSFFSLTGNPDGYS